MVDMNYNVSYHPKLNETFRAEVFYEAEDYCRKNCTGKYSLTGVFDASFEKKEDWEKFKQKFVP